MVERHPYTVDTGVQFSNEVPEYSVSAKFADTKQIELNGLYRSNFASILKM